MGYCKNFLGLGIFQITHTSSPDSLTYILCPCFPQPPQTVFTSLFRVILIEGSMIGKQSQIESSLGCRVSATPPPTFLYALATPCKSKEEHHSDFISVASTFLYVSGKYQCIGQNLPKIYWLVGLSIKVKRRKTGKHVNLYKMCLSWIFL